MRLIASLANSIDHPTVSTTGFDAAGPIVVFDNRTQIPVCHSQRGGVSRLHPAQLTTGVRGVGSLAACGACASELPMGG
jgi:hypothetical protein